MRGIDGEVVVKAEHAANGEVRETLDAALATLSDFKAEDVRVYEPAPTGIVVDRVIVASGDASRHLDAMAAGLRTRFKGAGRCAIEGDGISGWVLVDAGPLVVHLMTPDRRHYYDLESLWRRVA
jgi:ribosome-associated protein